MEKRDAMSLEGDLNLLRAAVRNVLDEMPGILCPVCGAAGPDLHADGCEWVDLRLAYEQVGGDPMEGTQDGN